MLVLPKFRFIATTACLLWTVGCGGSLCVTAWGAQVSQEIVREEAVLIDQPAFDLITLTKEAGGASVKVFPIPFPGRTVPSNPAPGERLQVVLTRFPEREYEIFWRDIAKVELYEQRIYAEALERLQQKDFIAAFQNLSFLMKNYPEMSNLEGLRQEFLLQSARDRFSAGQVAQTLSALEALRDTAPSYSPDAVNAGITRAADALIRSYQEAGDLASAKAILNRLKQKYGPTLPVVVQWETRLEQMARDKLQEAQQLMAAKQYRAARDTAAAMLSILPEFTEGEQLIAEINRVHPMVRVGVMQRSARLDPASLIDWPARRAGGLVAQPLFQFLETGPEGGNYGFALGTYRLSDDRQQLLLSLDESLQSSLNAFALAQLVVRRAEVDNPLYEPSWAAIFKSVSVGSARQVLVQLQRPHVLPYALMQWVLPAADEQGFLLPGPYRVEESDSQRDSIGSQQETSFQLRPDVSRMGRPVEIVEIFYDDPKQAVNDLLRGEIDLLDQLYPADAKRLATDRRLRIGRYALPTSHMLVPTSPDPYVQNLKFRRALLYATNRQATLTGELLNSTDEDDGRLISGPFPLGQGQMDVLAYAYDASIEPTAYSPQLAKLLITMAEDELREAAEVRREPAPKRTRLIIGCPDYEFARVAVQALIQQWINVGVEAEMLVLSPDQTVAPPAECDFVYVVATLWEPATDIERLLGGHGLAATDNPFIIQGLEKLRAARNWREVRQALQDLHQLIDYHLPLLPLWQVTDRFAVHRHLQGLEEQPVSLYEDVGSWRTALGADRTAAR